MRRLLGILLSALLPFASAYTRVYNGGALAPGWTATASSGSAIQTADAGGHAGAATSLSVTLPAGGSLVLSDAVGVASAQLALYLRPPSSVSLASLALSLSVNNASLCVLGGTGGCTIGLPDADGWLRVAANLSQAAVVRELRLRNGGAAARFSLGDAVLATAADLATRDEYGVNAPFCDQQAQNVFDACGSLDASAVCCAAFGQLNDAGCFCVPATAAAEGANLQLSSQLADPSLCDGNLDSTWMDGPACFQPPSSVPPGWDPSGAPPLPGAPTEPGTAGTSPTAVSAPVRARVVRGGVGAYVGIAAATLAAMSLALAVAVSSAEEEMTQTGESESWLHRCAASQPPWMHFRPCA